MARTIFMDLVGWRGCRSSVCTQPHRVIGMLPVPESGNFFTGHTDVSAVTDLASKGARGVERGRDALIHAHADAQVPL